MKSTLYRLLRKIFTFSALLSSVWSTSVEQDNMSAKTLHYSRAVVDQDLILVRHFLKYYNQNSVKLLDIVL